MFADPQSIRLTPTVTHSATGGTVVSLPRTGSGNEQGAFRSSDGDLGITISHRTVKGRVRDTMRVSHRKVAADPFDSSVNAEYSMSISITIDHPSVGYTVAQAKAVVDGVVSYLADSTGAKVTQLLGGES